MFALVNGLTEQVEEGFFSVLDSLAVTELKSWNRNGFSFHAVKVFFEFDSDLLKLIKVISFLKFLHYLHDLRFFGSSIKNGMLTDFFPLELIKVIRNTSHEAKFRYKQNFMLSSFVFGLEQRLFWFANGDVVLGFVIVKHVSLFATGELFSQILVNNIFNLVVSAIAVVDLHDEIDQSILDNVSFVVSVTLFVFLVKVINVFQHCLISDDFFRAVNSQENSFFQHHKVRFETAVHVEVVDFLLVLYVEELSCLANFGEPSIGHCVSETIVEEEKECFRIVFDFDDFDFFDCHFEAVGLEFSQVLCGFLVADEVHSADGGI
jgi:hypothetical protein